MAHGSTPDADVEGGHEGDGDEVGEREDEAEVGAVAEALVVHVEAAVPAEAEWADGSSPSEVGRHADEGGEEVDGRGRAVSPGGGESREEEGPLRRQQLLHTHQDQEPDGGSGQDPQSRAVQSAVEGVGPKQSMQGHLPCDSQIKDRRRQVARRQMGQEAVSLPELLRPQVTS